MSGGSFNYIYSKLEYEVKGKMGDIELNDLMDDIINLLKDLEWATSGDDAPEDYEKSVAEFKKKWFKTSRKVRLQGYIDKKAEEFKEEMTRLVNADTVSDPNWTKDYYF